MKLVNVSTLALVIALTGCGSSSSSDEGTSPNPGSSETDQKQKEKNNKMDPKFIGNWQDASLMPGKTDPVAVGCEVTDFGSSTGQVNFSRTKSIQKTVNHLVMADCSAVNTITRERTSSYNASILPNGNQILVIDNQQYTYTIKGDLAVRILNEEKVCGHNNWQARTYKSTDAHLKACNNQNSKGLISPYTKPDALKDIAFRLRPQGTGIVVDSRDTAKEGSQFGNAFYLTKL